MSTPLGARAAAQLAGMWVGRIMAVEPALGRVRKAADLIDELDFVYDVDERGTGVS